MRSRTGIGRRESSGVDPSCGITAGTILRKEWLSANHHEDSSRHATLKEHRSTDHFPLGLLTIVIRSVFIQEVFYVERSIDTIRAIVSTLPRKEKAPVRRLDDSDGERC